MRTFTLFALLSACLLTTVSAASKPNRITFILGHDGWVFSVSPEGRLDAQFGSGYDDHAYLPEGTVDVALLRSLLEAKLMPTGSGDGTQVALNGESAMSPVGDSSLLRYLILNKTNQWKFNPGTDEKRIRTLMQRMQLPSQTPVSTPGT